MVEVGRVRGNPLPVVISARTGTQGRGRVRLGLWVPAFAGMTGGGGVLRGRERFCGASPSRHPGGRRDRWSRTGLWQHGIAGSAVTMGPGVRRDDGWGAGRCGFACRYGPAIDGERHVAPTSSVILGSTQDPEPQGVTLAALNPGFRQDDGRGAVVAGAGAILWRLPFPSSRRTPGPKVAGRVMAARDRRVRRNRGSRLSPG